MSDRIDFDMSDDEYAEHVREQQQWFRDLAALIERGGSLERTMDRKVVAAILRHHADQMREAQPRKPGQSRGRQIDYGSVALEFAVLVHGSQKMAKSKAVAVLGERHDVSDTTIKNAIDKQGEAAKLFVLGHWQPPPGGAS